MGGIGDRKTKFRHALGIQLKGLTEKFIFPRDCLQLYGLIAQGFTGCIDPLEGQFVLNLFIFNPNVEYVYFR